MQWSKDRSILLSKVLLVFFALVLLAIDIMMMSRSLSFWLLLMEEKQMTYMRITVGLCSVPAWYALFLLWRLMGLLRAGDVFTKVTVRTLRYISWCCFAVCAVCLAGMSLVHFSMLLLSAAAALMGLIVRIVKNVLEQAVAMKEELDLTV